MSPKRIAVFVLLVVGWPFWVAQRTAFGERMFVLLGAATAIGFGSVWVVAQDYWAEVPVDVARAARGLFLWLEIIVWVWLAQAAAQIFHWTAVALRERQGRHPWDVGSFWVGGLAGGAMDVIAAVIIAFWGCVQVSGLPDGARELAQIAVGTMAGAFVLLAMICLANDHVLPVKPPLPRAGRKPSARYIARLPSKAKVSREGLADIFSRRDPALRELTKS